MAKSVMHLVFGPCLTAFATSAWLLACGQTAQQAPPDLNAGGAEGGVASSTSGGSSGGTTGGASAAATGGAAGGEPNECAPTTSETELSDAPLVELPTRLEGTLCGGADALWITFVGHVADSMRQTIRAQLASPSSDGAYTVSLFGLAGGVLVPLDNRHETHVFQLDEGTPELVFSFRSGNLSEDRVFLKLEGPAGPVALDLDRPLLPPIVNCGGLYESLPVQTPPLPLPARIETNFCNARDSRAWAIEVAAGRPVTVTLENPWAIEAFDFGVYRSDVAGYQPLPVSAGDTNLVMGLVAHRTLRFTPTQSGVAALYGSLGYNRGEAVWLRVEQE